MKPHSRILVPFALSWAVLVSGLSLLQPAQAASWLTNGPLNTARSDHTATLLSNGKVLVAGGWNGSYLSSAELFDPATGKWTATGAMTTNRCYHTATMLPNGKVLVVGGYCNVPPYYLLSAELYDPVTGTWTNTGPAISTHVNHTATLLPNGKVLVVGGTGSNAELYDPASGTWANTGAMNRPRWYHAATLLTNGNVLVAGGDYNYLPTGYFSTAEVYNPLSGTWTSTSAMTTNRTSATATLLPDGKVLVAGGWLTAQVQTTPPAYSSFSLTSAELYDPATGNWTATTNTMTIGRDDHTASLLPNGQVLMAGGFESGPGELASLELFDPMTGAWIAITNTLNIARWAHTATLLPGGRILVAGGIGPNGVTNSTELYDPTLNPATGTWTNTGAVNTERLAHTATLLPNGQVLVAGGVFKTSAELYEPVTGTWAFTGSLTNVRYYHTATLLPNGKVLVAGGVTTSSILFSAELYDRTTETWTATGALNSGREWHTATLLSNGKVLATGGDSGFGTAELYDPATGKWTATGKMISPRRGHTATLLPTGKVVVTGGQYNGDYLSSVELFDPASETWTLTGSLNHARAAHTATLLASGKLLVVGGEDASDYLSSAEVYDPVTGLWTATGALNSAREFHTATLLASGKVLVAGGDGYGAGDEAELFDPITGLWTETSPMNQGRLEHTATLLPDGKVLVVGGYDSEIGALTNVEVFDANPGFGNSWRPQIASRTSPFNLGSSLAVTGSLFCGISGASGGNTQDSSTDYPLVQLRSIESGQTTFLPTTNWSTNSFTSRSVWNFPPGYALATVFVNGIPSTSSIVNISVPILTPPTITDARKLTNGTFQFAFTNSVGAVFGAMASTNVSLPLSNWTALGGVTEISPGQFQFTDPQAANNPRRFYLIRSP